MILYLLLAIAFVMLLITSWIADILIDKYVYKKKKPVKKIKTKDL